MNSLSIDIVSHVLAVLDNLIVPHIESPTARAFADISSRLLHQVVVRETRIDELAASHGQHAAEAESALKRLLDSAAIPTASIRNFAEEDILVRAFSTDEKLLDTKARKQMTALKTRRVQQERALLEQLDPEIEFGIASIYHGGRVDRSRVKFIAPRVTPVPEMTAPALQAILRSLEANWTHATVKTLSRIQGGFSKQTLRAEIENTAWGGSHFIIRQDRPNAFTETTVATEFPIIKALFAAGMSVAEPLYLGSSKELGPAFIISRQVSGANDPAAWKEDPASVQRFLSSLSRQLALLHGVSAENLHLAANAGATVTEHIRSNIDHWSAIGKLDAPGSPRLLNAIRAWLLHNIPTATTRVAVIHGDLTLANLLTDGGNVTALLDWEFCHLGDPQEDLNFVRLLLEGIGSWKDFMKYYAAAGGCSYRPEDATFWRVWSSFRSAAGCANALNAYRAGFYGSAAEALTLAVAGLNFGPRFQLEAAESIVARA